MCASLCFGSAEEEYACGSSSGPIEEVYALLYSIGSKEEVFVCVSSFWGPFQDNHT